MLLQSRHALKTFGQALYMLYTNCHLDALQQVHFVDELMHLYGHSSLFGVRRNPLVYKML